MRSRSVTSCWTKRGRSCSDEPPPLSGCESTAQSRRGSSAPTSAPRRRTLAPRRSSASATGGRAPPRGAAAPSAASRYSRAECGRPCASRSASEKSRSTQNKKGAAAPSSAAKGECSSCAKSALSRRSAPSSIAPLELKRTIDESAATIEKRQPSSTASPPPCSASQSTSSTEPPPASGSGASHTHSPRVHARTPALVGKPSARPSSWLSRKLLPQRADPVTASTASGARKAAADKRTAAACSCTTSRPASTETSMCAPPGALEGLGLGDSATMRTPFQRNSAALQLCAARRKNDGRVGGSHACPVWSELAFERGQSAR